MSEMPCGGDQIRRQKPTIGQGGQRCDLHEGIGRFADQTGNGLDYLG